MERQLIFRYTYRDIQHIGNSRTISFFTETDADDESITSLSEEKAIEWLFSDKHFFQMFCEDFFGSSQHIKMFYGLQEPFTTQNEKPGDIDLLLVNTNYPDKAIAFECKRVKAMSIDEARSKVNNVGKVRKGIIQANHYQSLGFYQSYLMIILLDDGRHKRGTNVFFRDNKESVEHIYNIPWQEPLHSDVGIVFVKINQMTGRSYNLSCGMGFCIDKVAQPLNQTISMTNKVRDCIKHL